jgi:hypothetical protein
MNLNDKEIEMDAIEFLRKQLGIPLSKGIEEATSGHISINTVIQVMGKYGDHQLSLQESQLQSQLRTNLGKLKEEFKDLLMNAYGMGLSSSAIGGWEKEMKWLKSIFQQRQLPMEELEWNKYPDKKPASNRYYWIAFEHGDGNICTGIDSWEKDHWHSEDKRIIKWAWIEYPKLQQGDEK